MPTETMQLLPTVITHNYHPDRGALQNLCDLPHCEAVAILEEINTSRQVPLKANYLERRQKTERWLYGERTRKLGQPLLKHPIYFFLGDFADGLDSSRPTSLVIPLAALPPKVLTFTYTDSMASLPLATEEIHKRGCMPYHGQVFTLKEIKDVVAEFGLPDRENKPAAHTSCGSFIEVQIWDDQPLLKYISTQRSISSEPSLKLRTSFAG